MMLFLCAIVLIVAIANVIVIVVAIGVAMTIVLVGVVAIGLQLVLIDDGCDQRFSLLVAQHGNTPCVDPHAFLLLADNADGAHCRHLAIPSLHW